MKQFAYQNKELRSYLAVHNIKALSMGIAIYFTLGSLLGYGQNAIVSTLAGNGTAGFANGGGANAEFKNPYGVTSDRFGNVYVADTYNHLIRKIDTSGNVSTIAGNGISGFANGIGLNSQFNLPTGVACDGRGNIFVADQLNHRIRKIDPTGNVTTLAGTGRGGLVDGNPTSAQFSQPVGICLDSAGIVYVADYLNNRIRKIDLIGNVSTIAGNGILGFADSNGINAQFRGPTGVVCDISGNIYVADPGNHRIRKIDHLGNVSTLAGSGLQGFADGPAANAQFSQLHGVAMDAAGNMYVADTYNNRIRKIDPAGNVSTLAGNGNSGFADGTAANAQFKGPISVASDAAGNLYVADYYNHRIRKITIPPTATQAITPTKTLLEIYPNPFTEQTSIRFQSQKPEAVSLKIQHALGQMVYLKKFVSESGLNQITFNRTDLASGTYFVLLQTESGVQTGKMVVR